MILVRYATLVALVIWLGAMVDERFGDLFRRAHLLTYACGAATVVGLFVLKFLGPPPMAFVLRAGDRGADAGDRRGRRRPSRRATPRIC